jgi:DinB superfamily
MDDAFKKILWQQFGAAIDMLENAMLECPDAVWADGKSFSEFWYLCFHTLFWLDLYLSDALEGFAPPTPFTLDELDPAGVLPERVYSKPELLAYLEHCRAKCRTKIANLTSEQAAVLFEGFGWKDRSVLEMLLDNMRHVQHHAAQLNLMLRQRTDFAPDWVFRTKHSLEALYSALHNV